MASWRALGDSPVAAVLIALLLYGGYFALRVARAGGDVSVFLCCGDSFCDPQLVPAGVRVLPGSAGYDGQFCYRFALEPHARTQDGYGIRLDNPAYRHQRILYPLLAHVIALGGGPERVVIALPVVNLAGLLVLAGVAAHLARRQGGHALWALVLVLFPGFLLTLERSLTEIVAAALLLSAISFWNAGRSLGAGALCALAVLARETSIILPVVILASSMLERCQGGLPPRRRGAWLVAALPLATLLLWQLTLRQVWGVWPLLTGGGNLGWPFVGLMSFIEPLLRSGVGRKALVVHALFLAGLAVALGMLLLRRNGGELYVRLGVLAHLVVALCATQAVWESPWSAVRTLSELAVLSWWLSLQVSDPRPRRLAAGLMPIYWLVVATGLISRNL